MKEEIIDDIRTMMRDEGTRPSFQRDGVIYDLFFVILEEDDTITLSAVPINPWLGKPVDFTLDSTWRKASLEKIRRHVERHLEGNWDC